MENLLAFARVLSDETRYQMMLLLCCTEFSVTDLVKALEGRGITVSQPTVSHHLAELRDANLVIVRKAGRQTFYILNQEQVTVCCGQLMTKFAPLISVDQIPVRGSEN
ncbi:MAG: hypothetical protein BroJett018_05620 [Chloroflexota bacterium]|nr:ArsR family transcriptional regulator [Chloroflexota bacterium]NOG63521.1 winged helix-turn-helix transcriptional regulator [Chloroflexota bacterium]GIK62768.1 MAG: hypothetical protein BroJett018_05620 [Chloroflexota bacterium]